MHYVAVYRPNSRSIAVSQGKGGDLSAAKASGVMEAIESHHAEHPDMPLWYGSEADVISSERGTIDTLGLPRTLVGRYHRRKPILWCEAIDLMADDRPILVPFEMVHTNYTRPLPAGSGNFQMSSNGLASGNCAPEAIVHGLCEVIERDALALWRLRGGDTTARGRLSVEDIESPLPRRLIDQLGGAGLAVGIWDITTDVRVPVFYCALADQASNALRQVYASHGSGCHPCREIALARALTEAAQTRLTYIAGARDDANREFFETARNPERVSAIRARLEAPVPKPPSGATFGDGLSFNGHRFHDDLTWMIGQLRVAGMEHVAIVSFKSRIDGIAVVRVIVPGLEGLADAPGYVRGQRAALAHRLSHAEGGQAP